MKRETLRRRILGWIQLLLTAFGIACLGLYGWILLDGWWLDRQVEIPSLDLTTPAAASVTPTAVTPTAEAPPPEPPAPGAVVGRVRVPRLDIDTVVLEGIENRVLRRAAGRIPGTRLPWEPGTVGVAAHRDTFFRDLRDVERGDLVELVTEHGTWSYRVRDFQVVDPGDVHVLEDGERPSVVLVTCYPFDFIGPAPRRFVVFADAAG